MKKLMVLAAVVCAAVAAQATATMTWSALLDDAVSMKLYYTDAGGVASLVDTQFVEWGGVWGADCSVDQITSEGTYDFYAIAYDNANRYALSSTMPVKFWQAESGELHNQTEAYFESSMFGDWKSVPEPTSAMLMLLGIAGLALKRRRA